MFSSFHIDDVNQKYMSIMHNTMGVSYKKSNQKRLMLVLATRYIFDGSHELADDIRANRLIKLKGRVISNGTTETLTHVYIVDTVPFYYEYKRIILRSSKLNVFLRRLPYYLINREKTP